MSKTIIVIMTNNNISELKSVTLEEIHSLLFAKKFKNMSNVFEKHVKYSRYYLYIYTLTTFIII